MLQKCGVFLDKSIALTYFISRSQKTKALIHNLNKEWSEHGNKGSSLLVWSMYAAGFSYRVLRVPQLPIIILWEVLIWRHEMEKTRRLQERSQKLRDCYSRLDQQWTIVKIVRHVMHKWLGIIGPENMTFEVCEF